MNVNKEHKRLFDYFINGVTVPCSGDKVSSRNYCISDMKEPNIIVYFKGIFC